MTWPTQSLVPLALALALLVLPTAAHAQLPLVRGSTAVADFVGYAGNGFDPPPGTGRLDSDLWVPFGLGIPTTPFGGNCNTGVCARGAAGLLTPALGGAGFYSVPPGGPFPSTVVAMLVSDAVLNPGGVRLRLTNADSSAVLTHVDVEVIWSRRVGLIAGTPDAITFAADDCSAGTSFPIMPGTDMPSTSTGLVHWETHDTTFTIDLRPAPRPPGHTICISFGVGMPGLVRDLLAIGRVSVTVPDASCGDHFVDMPDEDCEPSGGAVSVCSCDPSCHFPGSDTPCDEGDTNPCTAGGCEAGRCVPLPLDTSHYVPECDLDGNPCTFEGCVSGACDVLSGCPDPSSSCRTCDPATFSCDVPAMGVPGCCTGDADCFVDVCLLSSCDGTGTCTTPVPSPACADGGVPSDGGVIPTDGGGVRDGGNVVDAESTNDGGPGSPDASTPVDASGSGIDGGGVTSNPGLGFGGGGGCRCRVGHAGTGVGGTAWVLLALLVVARRRRSV